MNLFISGALAVAHLATEHMRQVLWFDDKSFEGSGLYQFRNVLANTKIEHIMNTIDKSMPFCWANAKPLRDAVSELHHRSSTRVRLRLRLSYVSDNVMGRLQVLVSVPLRLAKHIFLNFNSNLAM